MTMNNKISQKDIEDILSLTSMQEGMLFHYLEHPESEQYFEQLSLELQGTLDVEIFTRAWANVVEKNQMLRSTIRWDQLKKPVQLILKDHPPQIQVMDLTSQSPVEQAALLQQIKVDDRGQQFDLQEVPFRITLVQLTEEHWVMIMSYHHILFDGWSTGIILKEFLGAYKILLQRGQLPRVNKASFKAFLKMLEAQDPIDQAEYWKSYLGGMSAKAILPIQKLSQPGQVKSYSFQLSTKISENFVDFTRRYNLTQASLFYTAWGLLLQKYGHEQDVTFGTTVSGRGVDVIGIEEMVGLCINTIPCRIQTNGDPVALELLQGVHSVLQERKNYENTSLVEIKKYSGINAREQLFDSIMVIENYPLEQELFDQDHPISVQSYEMIEATNFDLTVSIEMFDQVKVTLLYHEDRLDDSVVEQLGTYFMRILTGLVRKPHGRVSELELLDPSELEQLLVEFNQTTADYPQGQAIQEIFEEQVAKFADRVAVTSAGEELTYLELNRRANQLARLLREKGVGPDQIVGLLCDRSLEMIVGIMAILKAGGAYLPISPAYPAERITYMLEDCQASLLLTKSGLADHVSFAGEKIWINDSQLYTGDGTNLPSINQQGNLAYIIYTSGSTGQPKGVMIEHGNLIRLMKNDQYLFEFNHEDIWTLFHSFCFDFSVWEIFGPLLYGGKLVLVSEETARNTSEFLELLKREQVTVLNQTPSAFYNLLTEELQGKEADLNLRYVIFGGEALKTAGLLPWFDRYPKTRLINMYGITETTVHVTYKELTREDLLAQTNNVGRPIPTLKVYVMDQNQRLLPVGMPGEICVAGAGVARGYLNRPQLTAEKFVINPYLPEERLYRSGDLARLLPTGELEYLGRIDQQVKIRGYRIELGEIENRLLQHPVIEEVVVLAKEDQKGDLLLWAYYISGHDLPVAELRSYLMESLPEYMIPTYFVHVQQMPLTSNGKVDRKALLELEVMFEKDQEYQAPKTGLEETLAEIWAEVLATKEEELGVNDDFFELGGHSLKMTALVSRIHKELHVKLPLQTIFEYPTIRGLADHINSQSQNLYQALQPVPVQENYPLSSVQRRLAILHQFDQESLNYNMTGVLELVGPIDLKCFQQALQQLIRRHESLRTSFQNIAGEIVQKVHHTVDFALEVVEVPSDWSKAHLDEQITQLIRPFDLSKAPLLRAILLRQSEERAWLLLDLHHIIADGISLEILKVEFSRLYQGDELAPLPFQYKDYAVYQNQLSNSVELQAQEEYWREQFSDQIPVLNLPTDYPRPAVQSFAGDTITLHVEQELVDQLNDLATEHRGTLYMVLLTAYKILLHRYTGQTDLVVGSPIAGRSVVELESLVGMFVNTLALRSQVQGDQRFIDLLATVKETTLGAYENQEYQLEDLIDKLDLQQELSRNPLFDTVLALQNQEVGKLKIDNLTIRPYEYKNKIAKFDLTVNVIEQADGMDLELEYCTDLFQPETIQRLGRHLVNILRKIVAEPEIKVIDIDLLSAEEREQILIDFNQTQTTDLLDLPVQSLFEEQVVKSPDSWAVIDGTTQFTYDRLNRQANQLARQLRKLGVERETIVGIMVDPSPEMVIGLLAILKAGGAFLPIAPDLPQERVEYILADAQVGIFLTDQELGESFTFAGQIIDVNEQKLFTGDESNLSVANEPIDLAYLIYTSGTTGKPKGVMIEHRSLVNLCYWHNREFAVTAQDRATKLAGFGFDASVWEMFPYLICGASLHLISEEIKLNLSRLNQYFEEQGITISFLPTQICEQFMRLENHSLRILLTGGDKLKHYLPTRYQLVNNYGPTENTVVSTSYAVQAEVSNIPIGRPVSNTQVYILDDHLNVQPIGVPGEICLAGVGLARGYLNQPELTVDNFVPHPFEPGARLYRTGDRGKWLKDGTIAYLDRLDNQVQIRGYRIELGEIESLLLQHPEIPEALVVVQEDQAGESNIVAYLVSSRAWTVQELRSYLAQELPNYMVPAQFIQVESFPLTVNGKIDREQLGQIGRPLAKGRAYQAPATKTEQILVEIWKEVLGNDEPIGINDPFFELGGHSLKATRVVAEIYRRCQVEIPLSAIFQYATIQELATLIDQTETRGDLLIQPAPEASAYPVTSAQKRLFVLQQLERESIGYNMPTVLQVEGQLDTSRLNDAFQKLIQRHEILRTGFAMVNGETVQRIEPDVKFALEVFSVGPAEVKECLEQFVRPFNLQQPPLLRAAVVHTTGVADLLVLDLHHLISDGQSMQILISDLVQLYDQQGLPELRIQYKDYAVWLQEQKLSTELAHQEEYWLQEFAGEIPVLDLPTDYTRPAVQSFEGDSLSFELDQVATHRLKALLAEQEATLYMAFLAMYNIFLAKLTGQEDIVVGMPISRRQGTDLDQVMGMFVNTLALRNAPRGDLTFVQFLDQVKTKTLLAFDNQDYPFEDLVNQVVAKRDMSRNPLFDTMLVLQSFDAQVIKGKELELTPYPLENKIAKFDLELSVFEADSQLYFVLDYCTKLFTAKSVQRFKDYLIQIIRKVIQNPAILLSEIEVISQEEKQQLIYGFNDNQAPFSEHRSVYQLVEEWAVEKPDQVAVIYQDQQVTYRELNQRANRLARQLREFRVGEDQLVGILLDRSPLMIVSILAVWKAGGAYIPLDPEYPRERIETIMEDSQARVLLTCSEYLGLAGEAEGYVILDLDHQLDQVEGDDQINLDLELNMNSLAYVIYTSGSTGKPKGAMVEHIGMMNHLQAKVNDLQLTEQSIVAQNASQCFDISVWQFFAGLLVGGQTVIYSKELVLSPGQLMDQVQTDQITIFEVVPSYLAAILDILETNGAKALPELTYLLVTGETVKPQLVRRWFEKYPQIKMVNAYGPTEASDDITHYIMDQAPELERVPIGKSLQNFNIYIVDKYMNLCPIGVKGEICVSGVGVGRGYLNNQEKTQQAFMEDPFVEEKGRRLYKTGDLGRWFDDGVIEFFGRKDYQVKVRGFRIELGEIESIIVEHPALKEAVVIDQEDHKKVKYLCAYIVATRPFNISEMREHLAKKLPDYMIPSDLIQLEQIPLTPNGKVDRKALLKIEGNKIGLEENYAPPQTPLEMQMTEIWKEVLGLEKVGVNDNFFDVGGNSFDIIAIKNKIQEVYSEEFPVVIMFRYPTIRSLARHLEQSQEQDQAAEVQKEKHLQEIDKGKSRLKQRMRRRSGR